MWLCSGLHKLLNSAIAWAGEAIYDAVGVTGFLMRLLPGLGEGPVPQCAPLFTMCTYALAWRRDLWCDVRRKPVNTIID